jgi:hypothetical protein
METFGRVEAILNDQLLLITSEYSLNKGEIVTVFQEVTLKEPERAAGIDKIFYPKGDIRIICFQKDKVYLADRFREIKEKTRRITSPSPLSKALGGLTAQLQGETKEIIEEIPGRWSINLNESYSLSVQVSNIAEVGDLIGRI